MGTPTHRSYNFDPAVFTPALAPSTPITITGINDVSDDDGGDVAKYSGDADTGPTTIIADYAEPTLTIKTADRIAAAALPFGTWGSLTITHRDAKNGDGSGAIVKTAGNCMVASNNGTGSHRKFGEVTIQFLCVASGAAPPIVTTVTA